MKSPTKLWNPPQVSKLTEPTMDDELEVERHSRKGELKLPDYLQRLERLQETFQCRVRQISLKRWKTPMPPMIQEDIIIGAHIVADA